MIDSLDHLTQSLVSHPDQYGGRPQLPGTGIPIWILADLVQAGETMDDCLAAYPSLTRDLLVRFWPLLQRFPATPPPLP